MIKNYKILGYEFIFATHDQEELTSSLIHKYGTNIDLETVYAYRYLIKPGDTVIDIGANMGWNTMFASFAVTPKGHVFSFEPDADNFQLLTKNIKLNVLPNVTAIKKAVSNFDGTADLYLSKDNFGNHILNPSFYNAEIHNSITQVTSITLDSMLDDIQSHNVRLIKIDVEGNEPKVLFGGRQFIQKYRPFIILEFHPFLIKQCGSSMFDLLSFMDTNNYLPHIIKPINQDYPEFVPEPISIFNFLNLGKELYEQFAYKDILLVPAEVK
jgi:FkbM family methyltransferase